MVLITPHRDRRHRRVVQARKAIQINPIMSGSQLKDLNFGMRIMDSTRISLEVRVAIYSAFNLAYACSRCGLLKESLKWTSMVPLGGDIGLGPFPVR
ncbi:hypothetical protein MLD38_029437 [Melastoma candidum]|uniref:Uncharacterized protein n=1 Tax=Melastoma candidum TaxID=119954 RepID=A0ACB9N5V9_9MYRT|nr:hypothetical protein MLD38_029437 [Melastoma candidum]